MKGIILAGGKGSRLYPMTKVISKQLLPIYDKPMIYYPLTSLMEAGIQDIMIISTPDDLPVYEELLGDGIKLGLRISYRVQTEHRGIADALIIAEDYIGSDNVCLILGDNAFHGSSFMGQLRKGLELKQGAVIYGYPVHDPEHYGVVEFDFNNKVLSLEEKPRKPKSRYAVPGLYIYDSRAPKLAKKLKPSARGQLEITDLNKLYLKEGELKVLLLGRGMAWFDTGTPAGMLKASEYVETLQSRQGLILACPEETAWRMGFITTDRLLQLAEPLKNTDYGKYLKMLADERHC